MAKKGLKAWVEEKLGRYCEQAKKNGKSSPEVWALKWWRKKKKLSKMRAHLQKQDG